MVLLPMPIQLFSRASGFRKEELIGKNHKIFKHPDVPDEIYDKIWRIDERIKARV